MSRSRRRCRQFRPALPRTGGDAGRCRCRGDPRSSAPRRDEPAGQPALRGRLRSRRIPVDWSDRRQHRRRDLSAVRDDERLAVQAEWPGGAAHQDLRPRSRRNQPARHRRSEPARAGTGSDRAVAHRDGTVPAVPDRARGGRGAGFLPADERQDVRAVRHRHERRLHRRLRSEVYYRAWRPVTAITLRTTTGTTTRRPIRRGVRSCRCRRTPNIRQPTR